jgi:hypothetical protein
MTACLKIGPYLYEVRKATVTDENGFDSDKWGDVRHDRQVIRIADNVHEDLTLVTLVHEMLHCLGFMVNSEYPEALIGELAPILVCALQDNGIDLEPLKKVVRDARTK